MVHLGEAPLRQPTYAHTNTCAHMHTDDTPFSNPNVFLNTRTHARTRVTHPPPPPPPHFWYTQKINTSPPSLTTHSLTPPSALIRPPRIPLTPRQRCASGHGPIPCNTVQKSTGFRRCMTSSGFRLFRTARPGHNESQRVVLSSQLQQQKYNFGCRGK